MIFICCWSVIHEGGECRSLSIVLILRNNWKGNSCARVHIHTIHGKFAQRSSSIIIHNHVIQMHFNGSHSTQVSIEDYTFKKKIMFTFLIRTVYSHCWFMLLKICYYEWYPLKCFNIGNICLISVCDCDLWNCAIYAQNDYTIYYLNNIKFFFFEYFRSTNS